jgi:hypothetical protein
MENQGHEFIPHINRLVDICQEENLTDVVKGMIESEIVEIIRIIIVRHVESGFQVKTFELLVFYYLKLRFIRRRDPSRENWGFNHHIVEYMRGYFQAQFGRELYIGLPSYQQIG